MRMTKIKGKSEARITNLHGSLYVYDVVPVLDIPGYANLTQENITPLKNEPVVVIVPAETGAVPQEPCILLKTGDGTTPFNDLPFVAGRAADVYNWAKAATKPSYTASEFEGLDDYISGQIEDTDTQYQIVVDGSNDHLLKLHSRP